MEPSQTYQTVGKPAGWVSRFSQKPVLVFWEVTRSCLLSCVHCRASAIKEPLPGELTLEEGFRLIDQVASFGKPSPTVIFTGGDPLFRRDIFELLAYAAKAGVRFGVSPAVTELLTVDALKRLKEAGASAISISLDGASAQTHDSVRQVPGTYERTIQAIKDALSIGLNTQVNTTVMGTNYRELPKLFHLIRTLGVKTWEVFFLVKVGRGTGVSDLTPEESESFSNFLYDSSFYGVTVRTVEAPFIRRVVRQRLRNDQYWQDEKYLELRRELLLAEGSSATGSSSLGPRGTLDGDGIIFVGYDGTVHPGGLVPVAIGNVKRDDLVKVYRENELLKDIRSRKMNGHCGVCEYKEICGGSRARASSFGNDVLSSDPACVLVARSD
ncbi:MAG: TIGR04053 family radical SAM/SPASM domain-containing protein [Nitrososphaerota archaeon]|nr:TIGR04053 family radical SAM/SPASM domain-containing protein [Nitrososphaerota archaeon]